MIAELPALVKIRKKGEYPCEPLGVWACVFSQPVPLGPAVLLPIFCSWSPDTFPHSVFFIWPYYSLRLSLGPSAVLTPLIPATHSAAFPAPRGTPLGGDGSVSDLLLAERRCCQDVPYRTVGSAAGYLPTHSGLCRPTKESMRFWTFMVQSLAAYESSMAFVGFGERCCQFCWMLSLVHTHLSVQSMFLFLCFSPKKKSLFYHHFSQVTCMS